MRLPGLSTIQVTQSSDIRTDFDTSRVDFLQKEESHLFVGEGLPPPPLAMICVINMWPNRMNGSFLEQWLRQGHIVDMVALSLGGW